MLLGERALFAPAITALSLYFITRFEGNNHEVGVANMEQLYQTILLNNWKYLTLPVLINFRFVPPMLRVLIANIIGFCWIVFLSAKRRKAELLRRKQESERNSWVTENVSFWPFAVLTGKRWIDDDDVDNYVAPDKPTSYEKLAGGISV